MLTLRNYFDELFSLVLLPSSCTTQAKNKYTQTCTSLLVQISSTTFYIYHYFFAISISKISKEYNTQDLKYKSKIVEVVFQMCPRGKYSIQKKQLSKHNHHDYQKTSSGSKRLPRHCSTNSLKKCLYELMHLYMIDSHIKIYAIVSRVKW